MERGDHPVNHQFLTVKETQDGVNLHIGWRNKCGQRSINLSLAQLKILTEFLSECERARMIEQAVKDIDDLTILLGDELSLEEFQI
jgi:hypothetical protein